jgi:hypothetical protein
VSFNNFRISEPLTLPSGSVVTYREPLGKDRRELLDGFDGENLSRTGQVDAAIAFGCIVTKDGTDLSILTWQKKQDLFGFKDAEFYEETFTRAVMVNDEEFAEAQKAAKELVEEKSTELTLLSGRKVKFREPRTWDRRELLSSSEGPELLRKQGKIEEALSLVCLERIDDIDLTEFAWSKRVDRLTVKEAQYYQAVFMSTYFLQKADMQQVTAQAKKAFGSSTVSI